MANVCPLNGDNHRYFVFKTSTEFVPVTEEEYPDTATGGKWGQLYRKADYAVLGCNCGSVIKTEVKDFQYGKE